MGFLKKFANQHDQLVHNFYFKHVASLDDARALFAKLKETKLSIAGRAAIGAAFGSMYDQGYGHERVMRVVEALVTVEPQDGYMFVEANVPQLKDILNLSLGVAMPPSVKNVFINGLAALYQERSLGYLRNAALYIGRQFLDFYHEAKP